MSRSITRIHAGTDRGNNLVMERSLAAALCLVVGTSVAPAQVAVEFLVGVGGVSGSGFPSPSNFPSVPMGRRGANGGGSTGSGFAGTSTIALSLVDNELGTSLKASGESRHFSSNGGYTNSMVTGTLRLDSVVRVTRDDRSRRVSLVDYRDTGTFVGEAIAGQVTFSPVESGGRLIGTLDRGVLLPGDYALSASVEANGQPFGPFPRTSSITLDWALAMTPLTPRLLASTDATSDGSDDIFFHHTLTGVCVAWTRTVTNQTTFSILGGAAPNWELAHEFLNSQIEGRGKELERLAGCVRGWECARAWSRRGAQGRPDADGSRPHALPVLHRRCRLERCAPQR
jgi:hypothetical protein